MSEELLWAGIEWPSRQESVSEVTAEDLVRVRENLRDAATTRAQIKSQWKRDQQNAKLLSLVLQYVTDDALLKRVFFYLVERKMDALVITALVIPVLQQHITIEPLKPIIHQFWPSEWVLPLNEHDITAYYGALYDHFEEFEKVSESVKQAYIDDIIRVCAVNKWIDDE